MCVMNTCNFTGRLTRDPELRRTSLGKAVTHFSIAVRTLKKDDTGAVQPIFIECIAFEKKAELIAEGFKKGNLIGLSCELVDGSYTKDDGTKIKKVQFWINDFDFLEPKKEASKDENQAKLEATENLYSAPIAHEDENIPF